MLYTTHETAYVIEESLKDQYGDVFSFIRHSHNEQNVRVFRVIANGERMMVRVTKKEYDPFLGHIWEVQLPSGTTL